MDMTRSLFCAGLAAALAACGTAPHARYACGGAALTAVFDGQDRATVTIDAKPHALTRAVSGSGARYEGGAGDSYVEFWEHQGTARLTVGKTTYPECRKF